MRTALTIGGGPLALSVCLLCTSCGSDSDSEANASNDGPASGTVNTTTGTATTTAVTSAGPTTGGNTTGGPGTTGSATTGAAATSGAGGAAATTGATSAGMTTSSATNAGTDMGASSSGGATSGSITTGATTTGAGGSNAGMGSPGCGSTTPLESGTFMIDVDGTERMYILDVPDSYDTNHPYRLVFTWHPLGGSATQVVSQGYYGLKAISEGTAIFVSPDGLVGMAAGITGQGWYNTGGGDIAFLKAMLEHFNQNACIDQGRIFSTGFSFGGMMSNAIGCELADVFRAIAPMSGNLQGSGCKDTSDHPIAYLGIHGDNDTFVTTESGRLARDLFVERNHCQSQTEPSDPSICVAYTGCDEGYPVRWCEFSGGHAPWSEAARPVWDFFTQF